MDRRGILDHKIYKSGVSDTDSRHRFPKVLKDPDEQLIADIDLVTAFGVDKSEYARQRAAIRQEYQHVPDHTFRDIRGKILMRFLERRPNIYYWKPIRDKYEELSELNLAHELGLY